MGGPWYPNVIATACVWPCPYTSIDIVYTCMIEIAMK